MKKILKFCLFFLIFLMNFFLHGQDPKYYPAIVGKASMNVVRENSGYHLTPEESTSLFQLQKRLADLLIAQPALNPPRGFDAQGTLQVCSATGLLQQTVHGVPVPSQGFLYFCPYWDEKGKIVPLQFTTFEVVIDINNPEACELQRLHGGQWMDTHGHTIFYEPLKVREISGFPVFMSIRGNETLIISRNTSPYWLPLTIEEFIKVNIQVMEKELAELGPYGKDPSNPYLKRLLNHKAALETWPEEKLNTQAVYLPNEDPLQPDLAPSGSEDGLPLVITNPEWYDPSLPGTAFQLMAFTFTYGQDFDPENPEPQNDGSVTSLRLWEMLETTDWKSISRIMD